MAGTYYAAVEGDPLTSGKGSQVFATGHCGTITDESGRARRMAFIGDPAYCEACDSQGVIIGGAGVSGARRMIDLVNGGRRQAVGGDWVSCKCPEHPRVIAIYGRRWIIRDDGDAAPSRARETPAPRLIYDEQFTLNDGSGQPLANFRYRVRNGATVVASGVTDANGCTQRINAEGALRLTLEVDAHGGSA
ncbi:hypothetical protein R69927_07758 [Paraburkholderia domus]|jgi:hypothetical protein|uniref:PAAR domain-containing protein n=2 Tax=Paraburkholderia domus TaxID=2793075 RepID=UPI0019135EF9|nr:PAAR domain-containing protein [Paraburkholderia domus]MBK5054634.1 PAAR domain-containing protein [Burkholderia sp. R-70006]MBK5066433.1 PAAR domain-containing protein [Burkholderia sp. R-70199]MBK5091779.1 PAAR domain-containing protein [Burkholderia sp. R-69927]MBK5125856.1 PAAR domain-containing protein [Burkholderia sp. R-69980]MCI0152281.1 PAAR domain-containing protein [Paraburkholderia sediminicola]